MYSSCLTGGISYSAMEYLTLNFGVSYIILFVNDKSGTPQYYNRLMVCLVTTSHHHFRACQQPLALMISASGTNVIGDFITQTTIPSLYHLQMKSNTGNTSWSTCMVYDMTKLHSHHILLPFISEDIDNIHCA